ncbi:MAG: DMT family transporter [Pseudomonadota bacterium]
MNAGERRPDRVGLGILLILASTLLVASQDAVIKGASGDLTLWQIYVLRSLILIPALLAFGYVQGDGAATWRRSWGAWPMARAGLFVLTLVAVYGAIPFIPLSTVAAGVYTAPLFMAAISALFFGEAVRWHRWLAIAVGFAGVLLIVKPGSGSFDWLTLLPVAGGLFYALMAIVTRNRCRDIPPATLAVALASALLITGALASAALWLLAPLGEGALSWFLTGTWGAVGLEQWGILMALAALLFANGLVHPAAYQSAPTTIIATFDYCYLIFATLLGLIFFAEVPDLLSIVGMALIAAAGMAVARKV